MKWTDTWSLASSKESDDWFAVCYYYFSSSLESYSTVRDWTSQAPGNTKKDRPMRRRLIHLKGTAVSVCTPSSQVWSLSSSAAEPIRRDTGVCFRSRLSACRRTAVGGCRPEWAPRSAWPACWHRTRRRPATGCPPAGFGREPRTPAGPSASDDCAPAAGEPSPSTPVAEEVKKNKTSSTILYSGLNMEECFCHGIKITKGNCQLAILTFLQFWEEKKVRIGR